MTNVWKSGRMTSIRSQIADCGLRIWNASLRALTRLRHPLPLPRARVGKYADGGLEA